MAEHWNDAKISDLYIWYSGEDHAERRTANGELIKSFRDPGYFPSDGDSIEVRVEYRGHTFQWRDGMLTGIRNGSSQFSPPTAPDVLKAYFGEENDEDSGFRPVVKRLVELCGNEDRYMDKPLPVGLVPILRQGIDIDEYEHDVHCHFDYDSARRDAKFALPDEGVFR
jgi:hypothetical protein